ncbi:MAG TPA: hypothetical protein VJM78_00845 [Rhizomicrobium sp.]|nr:hypothetical protein [Rhizomicrobium sp.]
MTKRGLMISTFSAAFLAAGTPSGAEGSAKAGGRQRRSVGLARLTALSRGVLGTIPNPPFGGLGMVELSG